MKSHNFEIMYDKLIFKPTRQSVKVSVNVRDRLGMDKGQVRDR